MTVPIKEVIPREIPQNIVPIVNWFADSVDEMVNFGSHIIDWDCHPKSTGEENVPPTMLLRHFLDIIDSIAILVRQGTGDTPKVLIRTAMEVMLNLEYLFEKDTDDRAMAFIVADTLNQIKVAKKLHPNTLEGKALRQTFEKEKLLSNLISDSAELDDFLASKERLLNMPQFKKAYQEFKKLTRKGEKSPKWYRYFNGPRNIDSLAIHLGQKTMYEMLYKKWSGAVHGSDIYLGKISSKKTDGQIEIVQIRFIKDLQEVVSYTLILSSKVFSRYIACRIPDKLGDYNKWYIENLVNITKIASRQYINVQ